jgi:hypothetical protein
VRLQPQQRLLQPETPPHLVPKPGNPALSIDAEALFTFVAKQVFLYLAGDAREARSRQLLQCPVFQGSSLVEVEMAIEGGRDEMALPKHARLLTETADRQRQRRCALPADPRAGFPGRFGLFSFILPRNEVG